MGKNKSLLMDLDMYSLLIISDNVIYMKNIQRTNPCKNEHVYVKWSDLLSASDEVYRLKMRCLVFMSMKL